MTFPSREDGDPYFFDPDAEAYAKEQRRLKEEWREDEKYDNWKQEQLEKENKNED